MVLEKGGVTVALRYSKEALCGATTFAGARAAAAGVFQSNSSEVRVQVSRRKGERVVRDRLPRPPCHRDSATLVVNFAVKHIKHPRRFPR